MWNARSRPHLARVAGHDQRPDTSSATTTGIRRGLNTRCRRWVPGSRSRPRGPRPTAPFPVRPPRLPVRRSGLKRAAGTGPSHRSRGGAPPTPPRGGDRPAPGLVSRRGRAGGAACGARRRGRAAQVVPEALEAAQQHRRQQHGTCERQARPPIKPPRWAAREPRQHPGRDRTPPGAGREAHQKHRQEHRVKTATAPVATAMPRCPGTAARPASRCLPRRQRRRGRPSRHRPRRRGP